MKHQWMRTLGKNKSHTLVNKYHRKGFYNKVIFFGYMMMQEADLVVKWEIQKPYEDLAHLVWYNLG